LPKLLRIRFLPVNVSDIKDTFFNAKRQNDISKFFWVNSFERFTHISNSNPCCIKWCSARINTRAERDSLLKLDGRASCFQLSLNVFSFVLRHAFFDGFRSGFNQVFSILQAKTCDTADFFDNADFLLTE